MIYTQNGSHFAIDIVEKVTGKRRRLLDIDSKTFLARALNSGHNKAGLDHHKVQMNLSVFYTLLINQNIFIACFIQSHVFE